MRRPAVLAAVLCAIAVVAALAVGALQRASLAFPRGVTAAGGGVTLGRGEQACQSPIEVPTGGSFDRITLALGTFHRTGPAVGVDVRDTATQRPLAHGAI